MNYNLEIKKKLVMFYIVNLSQDKSDLNNYLSSTLLNNIDKNLKNGSKTILYLNKRGMYSSLICEDCNHLYKCSMCDLSLNVHNNPDRLLCHFCSSTTAIPQQCEKCNSKKLIRIWIWTQQIENSLKSYFKDKFIFRFDIDSVKNKTLKKQALQNLEDADIIIWTKMITTWFDFSNVWLIWVILLEQELNIPKYNAEENLYLNIKQLIWRGERKDYKTDIILQSYIPDNQVIKNISENNYKDFFKETLQERKLFNYPPFCEMITLEYRDRSKDKAKNFLDRLKLKLDSINKNNEFDIKLIPEPIKRYNQYYYKIIIKWDNLRDFLKNIKLEIMRNSKLVVIF